VIVGAWLIASLRGMLDQCVARAPPMLLLAFPLAG